MSVAQDSPYKPSVRPRREDFPVGDGSRHRLRCGLGLQTALMWEGPLEKLSSSMFSCDFPPQQEMPSLLRKEHWTWSPKTPKTPLVSSVEQVALTTSSEVLLYQEWTWAGVQQLPRLGEGRGGALGSGPAGLHFTRFSLQCTARRLSTGTSSHPIYSLGTMGM